MQNSTPINQITCSPSHFACSEKTLEENSLVFTKQPMAVQKCAKNNKNNNFRQLLLAVYKYNK